MSKNMQRPVVKSLKSVKKNKPKLVVSAKKKAKNVNKKHFLQEVIDKRAKAMQGELNESSMCGIKAYKGRIDCALNGNIFINVASDIIGVANDHHGFIPEQGSSPNPFTIQLYLECCAVAYLYQHGLYASEIGNIREFGGMLVPNFFAKILQTNGHVVDYKTKAVFNKVDPLWTETVVRARNGTANGLSIPVIVAEMPGHGREYLFGAGGSLNFTSMFNAKSDISALIAMCFNCMQVDSIPAGCINAETVCDSGFTGVRPVHPFIKHFTLLTTVDDCGPHRSSTNTVTANGLVISSDRANSAALTYLLKDYVFKARHSTNDMFKSCTGKNLWRFSVQFMEINFSKFAGLCTAFLIRTLAISTFSLAEQVTWYGLVVYWWGALVSRMTFLSRQHNGVATGACYSANNLKNGALLFPPLGDYGTLPAWDYHTLIVPLLQASSISMQTYYQPNSIHTPDFGLATGSIPMGVTFNAGLTFAGFTPAATSTEFNQIPLNVSDEITKSATVNQFLSAQCTTFKKLKVFCPCMNSYALGNNNNILDASPGGAVFWFPEVANRSSYHPIGGTDCAIQCASSFCTVVKYANYWEKFLDRSQNAYYPVIDAFRLLNTFTAFAAAQGKNDPSKGWIDMLRNNMRPGSPGSVLTMVGKDLVEMASMYRAEVNPVPNADMSWVTESNRIWDLDSLVMAASGLFAYAGAPALRAITEGRYRYRQILPV